ncbi:MAG TPA: hypothetical protein VG122_19785 [Gemmata sp.]|jgi:hypothetical protein|nr:hypothetical protein [Gemmata sp.]
MSLYSQLVVMLRSTTDKLLRQFQVGLPVAATLKAANRHQELTHPVRQDRFFFRVLEGSHFPSAQLFARFSLDSQRLPRHAELIWYSFCVV